MIGSVSTFTGNNADHKRLMDLAQSGGEWTELLQPADVSLCPAVCHPLYPTLTGKRLRAGVGTTSRAGVSATSPASTRHGCRRSANTTWSTSVMPKRPATTGTAGSSTGPRSSGSLGLAVETVVANDPFFGGVGRILAENQRAETLKYEIVTPINSRGAPNGDRLGQLPSRPLRGAVRQIVTADGDVAHSCCFGFGLDRITLALLRNHGTDPESGLLRLGIGSGPEALNRRAAAGGSPPRPRR